MKKLIVQIVHFFLKRPDIFLRVKDVFLTNPAEHLFRTVRYIKSKKKEIKNKYILDIGAADGNTARYFAENFSSCNIVGFEPIPEMSDFAVRNCINYPLVKILNIALGEKSGEADFHVNENVLSSSLLSVSKNDTKHLDENHKEKFEERKKINVKVSTLDELIADKDILLIKIDTQGTELNILKGATSVLKRTDYILVEMNNHKIYDGGCMYYEVDEFLRSKGFRLVDAIVIYRPNGKVPEYDALYENTSL